MNTRRNFLQSALGVAASASLPAWAQHLPGASAAGLRDLVPAGILVGAVADRWQMQDPRWQALLLANFNLITLGRLKWGFVRPSAHSFDFADSDWMAGFCARHKLAMHGHNLCWNANNPAWLAPYVTRANGEALLREHIATVVKRYSGRISSWDVVNEPIATWMGRSDNLYTGPWLDALGPAYMDIAFHATAEADPTALRVLNVAHVEQGGSGSDRTRTATLRLIEALLKRNVPVQAVGFESHLAGDYPSISTEARSAFVHELRQMGLQVMLTELDVDDTRLERDPYRRDELVSRCYSDYLAGMLHEAQPSRVIFFSPGDERNWYDSAQSAQFHRPDGSSHRPGLFDASLAPKCSYHSVASALKGYHA